MDPSSMHAPLLYKGLNELAELVMSDIFEQGNVFLAVLHMAGTCHGINCVYGLHARTEHSVQFNALWSAQSEVRPEVFFATQCSKQDLHEVTLSFNNAVTITLVRSETTGRAGRLDVGRPSIAPWRSNGIHSCHNQLACLAEHHILSYSWPSIPNKSMTHAHLLTHQSP